ncbi:MAG: 3-methyl-2-oxobutanoate hydroxymethyltransferase [Dehalococcoidia bacterium]|nr:MAG: 3-methyl-2-oxobutanoate hydroxymethyltransferase [Dehalococcoidia bacterium]
MSKQPASRAFTILDIQRMREQGKPITMVTAYDYPTAKAVDEAGLPLILVGDSLGMTVLGYDSTLPVTLEDMIHHGKAVVRGAKRAHVVVDMPFGSYQSGWQQALDSAIRLMKETGCGSVKLEGGQRSAESVARMVEAGIPVMGHIGLTPQSVNALGGWKVQGRTPREAVRLIADAKALAEAGAYAIVLELVPTALSHMITQRVSVPTIGIGSGPFTSGQVQVLHDILAIQQDREMKHARRFADVGSLMVEGLRDYREAVEDGSFPTAAESFYMDERALELIRRMTPSDEDDMTHAERVLREAHEAPDARVEQQAERQVAD